MKARRIDFSPGDWIGGTLGMSLEEEGLYIRLVARIYSFGEMLDADPVKLAKLCSVRPQVMRRLLGRLKLLGKFHETGGKLVSNRCETELKLAQNRLDSAVINGSKGGRPKDLTKPPGLRPGLATSTTTITIEEELSNESSIYKKARARAKPRRSFEGWSPDEQDIAFATKAGRTRSWIEHQSAKCRDHHVAKGNLFADLAAAWRTWVRNAPAFENEAAPRINGSPVYAEPWEQRLAAWRKGSRWLSDQWGPAPGDPGSRVPLELI